MQFSANVKRQPDPMVRVGGPTRVRSSAGGPTRVVLRGWPRSPGGDRWRAPPRSSASAAPARRPSSTSSTPSRSRCPSPSSAAPSPRRPCSRRPRSPCRPRLRSRRSSSSRRAWRQPVSQPRWSAQRTDALTDGRRAHTHTPASLASVRLASHYATHLTPHS